MSARRAGEAGRRRVVEVEPGEPPGELLQDRDPLAALVVGTDRLLPSQGEPDPVAREAEQERVVGGEDAVLDGDGEVVPVLREHPADRRGIRAARVVEAGVMDQVAWMPGHGVAKYAGAPATRNRSGPETGTEIMSSSMKSPGLPAASYPSATMSVGSSRTISSTRERARDGRSGGQPGRDPQQARKLIPGPNCMCAAPRGRVAGRRFRSGGVAASFPDPNPCSVELVVTVVLSPDRFPEPTVCPLL